MGVRRGQAATPSPKSSGGPHGTSNWSNIITLFQAATKLRTKRIVGIVGGVDLGDGPRDGVRPIDPGPGLLDGHPRRDVLPQLAAASPDVGARRRARVGPSPMRGFVDLDQPVPGEQLEETRARCELAED
ncbi:MAG: hypothetical protein U0Q15_02615 [Kineosporiaceae bacterium]